MPHIFFNSKFDFCMESHDRNRCDRKIFKTICFALRNERLLIPSSHENKKKALSPFYHKKIFLKENEYKAPMGVLH